jgi:hypothetical protein
VCRRAWGERDVAIDCLCVKWHVGSLGRDPQTSLKLFRAGFLALATAALMVAAPSARGGQTLVTVSKRITSFAQDGSFLAWTAGPTTFGFPCGRPHVERLTTGTRRLLDSDFKLGLCAGGITVGNGRALWTTPPQTCGNCVGAGVDTATFWRPHRLTFLGDFTEDPGEDFSGRRLTGLAADGGLHVLSYVEYRPSANDPCWNDNVACSSWAIPRGRIYYVLGGKRWRIDGRIRAALLGVGGGHIAFAPAMNPSDGPPVKVAENGRIDVIDKTAALLARVFPTGTALALAVSRTELAILLEKNDGSRVIERYLIADHSLVATTPVPADTSPSGFDMAGEWIVYHDGGQIFATDRTGAAQLVLALQTEPIGLSIEGQRIAWAQNHNGHHRIRAAVPPA